MNYAIIRLKKRSLLEARAMAGHALREVLVLSPNADPAMRSANTVIGPPTVAEVMDQIRAKLPPDRRRNAVPVIELLVGASPEAMQKMSREEQDGYFDAALAWIGERFGGHSNLVLAVIHRDETTPHMQVLLVPLLHGRLNARALIGNRQTLRELQTDFASKVAEPHGLRRGESGSVAKHTTIRSFYGAMAAVERHDTLPPRVPVPEPLPEIGSSSSEAQRAAYARREAEREEALRANAKRQAEIERLAALSVAIHGRSRRQLVDAVAEARGAKTQARPPGGVGPFPAAKIEGPFRRESRLLHGLPMGLSDGLRP